MKLELLTTLPHLWIGYLLAMCQGPAGSPQPPWVVSLPPCLQAGNTPVETCQLHSQPALSSAADACQLVCHVPGLGGAWVLSGDVGLMSLEHPAWEMW